MVGCLQIVGSARLTDINTYPIKQEDCRAPPVLALLCELTCKLGHKEHHHIAIGIAVRQSKPYVAVRRYGRDDINLLAEKLIGCSVKHSTPFPSPLAKVSFGYPALIDVYYSLRGLIEGEHLLRIKTPQDLASLRVTLEWYSLDLAIAETVAILQYDAN